MVAPWFVEAPLT